MSNRKPVKVDKELLQRVRGMYEKQAPKNASFYDSQIVDMALAHSLGLSVDVITKKNKTKIKCD